MKRDWLSIGFWTCVAIVAVGHVLVAGLQCWGSFSCRERGGVPVNNGMDCIKAEKR